MRYVALLRAINVGGHTVRMEHLRRLFETLGAASVETFIASGNVIFESAIPRAALEKHLETALEAALKFPVATFLRTLSEIAAVAGLPGLSTAAAGEAAGGAIYVGFLKKRPSAAASAAAAAASTPSHRFAVHGREVYWLRLNLAEDYRGPSLEKLLGPATFRNVTTIRKLAAKYGGGAG